jgi:DNA repair protein RadC
VRAALKVNAAAMILAHYVARHIMGIMCPVFLCAPSE